MKFHLQLKVPGMDANQIMAKLNGKGFEFRKMRSEIWESKHKITNAMDDTNILFEDERVEIQGGGDFNTHNFISFLAGQLEVNKPWYRHTKSDIGYERHGWRPLKRC